MTAEQYRHWYTFALRMAHRGFVAKGGRRLPRKSRRFVADCVKDFFRSLRDDMRYDPTLLGRIHSWDETDDHPTKRDRYGRAPFGPYVCDMVAGLDENWNPHYWSRSDSKYEDWDEYWGSRIRCCLRAGLDLASEPSAGVAGFTAGDLRRMYRGQVPAWLADGFYTGSPFEPLPEDAEPSDFATVPDEAGVWL
jgi:hypothetical protein